MRRALSITHSTRPTRITSQCLPVSSSPSYEGPVSPPDLLSHQLRPALPLPCPPLPSCPLARTSPPVPRLPTSPPRLPHFGPTLHMLALPHPPCYSSALLHLFLRHLICPVVTPGVPPSQCVPPPCPLATHSTSFLFPGVIFQTRKDGSLPPHVHYKIRQNSSFTEKTNEIRRAYWRPGPNTGGRFYFLYGFVWIQGEGLSPGGM